MTKPLCIYHGHCADGFTAAWIVNRHFAGDVDFHPGIYQDPPPDVTGRQVLMVDFSYKRPVIAEMAKTASSILILDHHLSAKEELADLGPPIGGAGPFAVFDLDRSGAQITWDFFFPQKPRPALVDYTGDRDLWRFKLPRSREVNAFVFAHEYTFENWDLLEQKTQTRKLIREVADLGEAIEKKHHKDVAELVGLMERRMTIGGHEVPAANLPYTLTSDAGHLMADGEPFAACFSITRDGVTFSLRSRDEGLDVATIAAQYGGGGHRNAAGFRIPFYRLAEFLDLKDEKQAAAA